jgi:hypothetical protein
MVPSEDQGEVAVAKQVWSLRSRFSFAADFPERRMNLTAVSTSRNSSSIDRNQLETVLEGEQEWQWNATKGQCAGLSSL